MAGIPIVVSQRPWGGAQEADFVAQMLPHKPPPRHVRPPSPPPRRPPKPPEWNGDPMWWKSWPHERPGPYVSNATMRPVKEFFLKNHRATTEEKVFRIAEFSATGQEIFAEHVTERQLANWLENPKPESSYRLLFASSRSSRSAIYSTFAQRVLSACGAPAAVWTAFWPDTTSSFGSFIDHQNGSPIFHGWMALRIQLTMVDESLSLLSEPRLSTSKHKFKSHGNVTHFPRLYFSYNSSTRKTTVLTTEVSEAHLRMIDHLKKYARKSSRPEEFTFQLLLGWFAAGLECFTRTAQFWDTRVTSSEMTSKILAVGPDHKTRVESAEIHASRVDQTKCDAHIFRAALIESAKQCQKMSHLLRIDSTREELLASAFSELERQCMDLESIFDSLVSRYDRFLNLLLNYTNIRMVEETKNLAESNHRQALQGARQAKSMEALAYDSKRDSEVMKTITVVTMIFLPATFVSTIFSMGFFNFDFGASNGRLEISGQGWIYLACTIPLTFIVLALSFAWMWWTGTKEETRDAKKAPAHAADTFHPRPRPRSQSV